jgi:aldehyde dehydrogenase (NAD+)
MKQMINEIISEQEKLFQTQKTKKIKFRLEQLSQLKSAIRNYEEKIYEALYADLHKSKVEAYSAEIGLVLKEISLFQKKLISWAKPQRVKTPLLFPGSKSRIYSEPFGKVLIISPWNYPFGLSLTPLVGAIAAGNTVVLKPSEISANTSQVLQEMLESVFEQNFVAVVQGGAETSQELLKHKFDYIFFTGSERVGKIIYQAAADQLTPITLELGGKSPCIVDINCNLEKASRRIAYGKFLNCGQTCIAPDYLFVHQEVRKELIEQIKIRIADFFGNNPAKSADYGRIIRKEHFEKLVRLMKDNSIILGGNHDIEKLYFEPTLIEGVENSAIMQKEIFGPILPIFTFPKKEEVVEYINVRPKPLALYIFSNDEKFRNNILQQTSSGAACVNDTVIHFANENLPFGGVGSSGIGSYHGRKSFETFSHQKSVMQNTNLFEIPKRFPPSDGSTLKILKWLLR